VLRRACFLRFTHLAQRTVRDALEMISSILKLTFRPCHTTRLGSETYGTKVPEANTGWPTDVGKSATSVPNATKRGYVHYMFSCLLTICGHKLRCFSPQNAPSDSIPNEKTGALGAMTRVRGIQFSFPSSRPRSGPYAATSAGTQRKERPKGTIVSASHAFYAGSRTTLGLRPHVSGMTGLRNELLWTRPLPACALRG
jgi:hypothetical protein